MQKIELNNRIKYFHFTLSKNLESIDKMGLIAKTGDNAISAETTQKVFFSEGISEAARCIDTWIKWRIVYFNDINNKKKYLNNYLKNFKPEHELVCGENGKKYLCEQDEARYKALHLRGLVDYEQDCFINNKANSSVARAYAYEDMYRKWKNSTYLALDLKEGIDFSKDDFDEALRFYKSKAELDCIENNDARLHAVCYNKKMEYLYGATDLGKGLKDWNLHTFKGHGVSRDKILGAISVNGKTDGISFAKKIAKMAKQENPSLNLADFDDWLNYVKLRETENKNEQEFSWNLDNDGKRWLEIFGTEKDKALVDAYLNRDIEAIKTLSKNGANPNNAVTFLNLGKEVADNSGKKRYEINSVSTMPILTQAILHDQNMCPEDHINFIDECISCGAGFMISNDPYIMPNECLDKVKSGAVKEHLADINNIAKNAKSDANFHNNADKNASIRNKIAENFQERQQAQTAPQKSLTNGD